jgi:ATP-dependent Clp protease protease subunit
MSLIPFVIEKTGSGERSMDILSRLLNDRIIFINGPIHSEMSHNIVAQLLHLESVDSERDIHVYLNSPGGEVTAGLAIYDVMQFIKPDVCTYVMGQACSMGSFLAQAGTAGKRYVLPYSRTMVHQPSGGARGMASDIEISYKEIMNIKKTLTNLYVKHNSKGKTYEEFERVMDRDTFMSAAEAVEFGLADTVVTARQ